MPGDVVADVLKTGNPLDKAVRNNTPAISDAASEVEAALKEGFMESSPPGVGDAYSLAREKYKLALVGQNASDPVTGNINPTKLLQVMGRMYPDSRTLGGGSTMTDQAVRYARNATRFFGGTPPSGPSWGQMLGEGIAALPGAAVAHFLPGFLSNPLVSTGIAAAPWLYRGTQALGRAWQASGPYGQNLLTRGASVAQPYIPGLAGSLGGTIAP